MGTLLGACLGRAGVAVDLVDVNREHVEALKARGAHIVGTVEFTVPVAALTPDELAGWYDLVFLLTKQTHNPTAFAQLAPHLHDRGAVCTLQNGVPEPAVAAAFGAARTLGCAVTWGATYLGPGTTQSTTAPVNWHSALGTMDGGITPAAAEVRDILALMCPAELTGNLMGIRWSKLLVNCAFSGMSAALGCTFGQILANDAALACAQHIARECLRVAAAQGIRLEPLEPGVDFRLLMDFATEEERLATRGIYHRLWGPAAAGKASMLQDLENGRATEIEFINGLLSDAGRRHGVPTPASDTVVAIVKGVEEGRLTPRMENLSLFDLA